MPASRADDRLDELLKTTAGDALRHVRDQALFLVDCDGRIRSWSEGVELILGWSEAEWLGRPLDVVFTEADVDAGVPLAEMRHAAARGRAEDDRWMRRKGGQRFFAIGALTRMRNAQGQLIGYLKQLRDFTQHRQSELERERQLAAALQERPWAERQSAALAAATEAVGDGVIMGDAQGIVRCNQAMVDLLGALSMREVTTDLAGFIGRFRLRPEREGPLFEVEALPFARAAAGVGVTLEMWATRPGPGGADVQLRCTAAPVRTDGDMLGAVAVHTDLAAPGVRRPARRDADRIASALHEREAELRALVSQVRDYAIYTLDTQGRISTWHRGAELMMGYTARQAIGMPFDALFTAEDRAAGRPAHEMRIAAETGEHKTEALRLRADGSSFEAAAVLTALRAPGGELLGYLKLTQDISELKRREREYEASLDEARTARALAERITHSKDEFLATISHELRTPLSAILGWAHVLSRGVADAETVQHGLAAISRNARTQVHLIEDLLDMNRIEAGQLRLERQPVDLGGVIAAAVDAALPAATARHIALSTAFAPGVAPVLGDAVRLQQVVANLLSNAIKFTPPDGQVGVSLAQDGDTLEIAVADTGQGIAADFLPHLFDRFRQQDATTTRRFGGLGLGLSIVQQLVALHGGTVQAFSRGDGSGATFTVRLPALVAGRDDGTARAAEPATQADAEPVRLDGRTLLLVDDEPDARDAAAHILATTGARVLAAGTAAEALALFMRERPDAVVSDIGMPDVDGYELMRRIRALPAAEGGSTPAVAFTAFTRPLDAQRALASGYQRHLAKPVSAPALLQVVAQLLGQAAAPP